MPEAELAKAADARGQARPHVQSPWALWTKLQNFGRKFEQVDDKDLAPAQVDAALPPETPASQPSVPSTSFPPSSLPSFFRARWPSLWARLSSWVRPLADIYFVVALCVLYATPTPRPDSPQAWRVVKAQMLSVGQRRLQLAFTPMGFANQGRAPPRGPCGGGN